MKEEELNNIWKQLDTRISTINDRTKNHTIKIKELSQEMLKIRRELEELNKLK